MQVFQLMSGYRKIWNVLTLPTKTRVMARQTFTQDWSLNTTPITRHTLRETKLEVVLLMFSR